MRNDWSFMVEFLKLMLSFKNLFKRNKSIPIRNLKLNEKGVSNFFQSFQQNLMEFLSVSYPSKNTKSYWKEYKSL